MDHAARAGLSRVGSSQAGPSEAVQPEGLNAAHVVTPAKMILAGYSIVQTAALSGAAMLSAAAVRDSRPASPGVSRGSL
jgi:hypothetical protein